LVPGEQVPQTQITTDQTAETQFFLPLLLMAAAVVETLTKLLHQPEVPVAGLEEVLQALETRQLQRRRKATMAALGLH
jgi:hypothetical protein